MTEPVRDFSVGILNYGTRDVLIENVDTCLRSGLPAERLLVWDNASDDGSAEALGKRFPAVRCVSSPRNLGYAGGMNGIVDMLDARRVVLVTADCFVTQDAIRTMLDAMDTDARIALVGCRIIDRRTGRIQSEGGDITYPTGIPLSRSWQRDLDSAGPGALADVGYLDGAILAVDRGKFLELGGFDASYFAYQEDVDLCWRARLRGYRVVCVATASALHATSASFRRNPSLRWRLSERNRIANNIKNLETPHLAIALGVEALYSVAVLFGASLLRMPGYRRAYGGGLVSLLQGLRGVLARRAVVQRSRSVRDREVLARHPKMGLANLAKALSRRAALAREITE